LRTAPGTAPARTDRTISGAFFILVKVKGPPPTDSGLAGAARRFLHTADFEPTDFPFKIGGERLYFLVAG
jgi:hypothetical protein